MALDLAQVVERLARFTGADLTQRLAGFERRAVGVSSATCHKFLCEIEADGALLEAAAEVKRLAGQINVTIHALGILLCLPHILEPDEQVESVSLGAGNAGREFDLETNRRVAEFKFIRWRGGAESIRQNGVFKDFFLLADSETTKRKYLYLLGTQHAEKFLQGGRALPSVLSKDEMVRARFYARFEDRFATVRDYYAAHRHLVTIQDVSPWVWELAQIVPDIDETAAV
ncbi:hypothetical protein [Sphingomonas sp.]|uniref:hypothetical protein n=1 Tax=Sphingomonas sp. TaxID=28214 RepID=UPI001B032375|nr:hypothetical protein [Sphingomonas sp.]MBO9712477.1 hypothetical protein [Sphingomonas sp.]